MLQRLADHVAALSYEDIPPDVVTDAKRLALDTIGVAIRGSTTEHGRIATRYAEKQAGDAATLLGGGRASAQDAALANGVCAHAIDFDDVYFYEHPETSVHSASSVVSAAVAAVEETGADGRALVTALVAGYDVLGRVDGVVTPSIRHRGFHPTSVVNGFGAAAAVASVYGLDANETANAIGIASDQASGTLVFSNDDSMMKHFHGGHPASDAVTAAKLAAEGYVGDDRAITGSGGYLETLTDSTSIEEDVEEVLSHLGERFEISRTNHKPYPACTHTHSPNDAARALREKADRPIDPAEIERVTLETYEYTVKSHNNFDPRSTLKAMLSQPYTVSTALLTGEVTMDQYDAKFYEDPQLRAMLERFELKAVDWADERYPESRPCRVTVEFTDGETVSAENEHPRGSRERPLSDEEVEAKFERLTSSLLPDAVVRDAVRTVWNLENEDADSIADRVLSVSSKRVV